MAVGTPVDEFELMRRRVKQEGKAAGQQRQQELKRQFARTGQLSSGAFIKQSGIEAQQQEQQQQRALEGVDIAQAGIQRQEREAEKGREFARAERLGGQEFAGEQAGIQRGFVASQQEAQNTFASLQAQIGREFTTQERGAAQKFASLEAGIQRDFQQRLTDQGRDFQKEITGFDEETGMTRADALQQEMFDFERTETKKVEALNAMNAMLNIGFSRAETNELLKSLGFEDMKFVVPGAGPTPPQPTMVSQPLGTSIISPVATRPPGGA